MIAKLVDMVDDFLFTFSDLRVADIVTIAIMGVLEIGLVVFLVGLL